MTEYPNIESIATGHNVALLDLTLITSITGADKDFLPILTPGKYRRGEAKTKANGAPDRAGFRSKLFTSSLMTLDQFETIWDTYLGAVTLYAWLGTTTPQRFNAYLDIGDQADYEPILTTQWGWCLQDVTWTCNRVQVLA